MLTMVCYLPRRVMGRVMGMKMAKGLSCTAYLQN